MYMDFLATVALSFFIFSVVWKAIGDIIIVFSIVVNMSAMYYPYVARWFVKDEIEIPDFPNHYSPRREPREFPFRMRKQTSEDVATDADVFVVKNDTPLNISK